MTANNFDIFGITETNIHWNNGEVYRRLMHEAKRYTKDSHTNITPSDTQVDWHTQYKPGGTVTIVKGKLTTMLMNKHNDFPLGRWSSITIGPPNHQLVIITAYIVNHTTIDPSKDKTSAYQQWQLLSQRDEKLHPRIKAIYRFHPEITSSRKRNSTLCRFQ